MSTLNYLITTTTAGTEKELAIEENSTKTLKYQLITGRATFRKSDANFISACSFVLSWQIFVMIQSFNVRKNESIRNERIMVVA